MLAVVADKRTPVSLPVEEELVQKLDLHEAIVDRMAASWEQSWNDIIDPPETGKGDRGWFDGLDR